MVGRWDARGSADRVPRPGLGGESLVDSESGLTVRGDEHEAAAMPEFTMSTDLESHSLLIDVVVPTGVARAFALLSDQGLLEQWWGPPDYPCQVGTFDFRPGGHVRYVMTGLSRICPLR